MAQNSSRGGKRSKKKRAAARVRAILVFIIVLLTIALFAVGCMMSGVKPADAAAIFEQEERFSQGVSVDGISLGGLNMEGAQRLLEQSDKVSVPGFINITSGGRSTVLDASGAGASRNTAEVLQQAMALGNTGDRAARQQERQRIEAQGQNLETTVTYDVSTLSAEIEQAAGKLALAPINASAAYNPDSPEVFDFVDAVDGAAVDAETLGELLEEYLNSGDYSQPLDVPFEAVPAEVTTETVRNSNSLIASTTSSFKKGSYGAANRVFNINKAASIITGVVIGPGETFSFNDTVGPRTAKTGWKEAGAINDGQSVDEIGGGICQVSSTLFNSVLKADLEIVKRSPHSWPLSYLPAGQDATVSTGGPDFLFKNNRETPVIIVARVDTDEIKEITVEIYGQPLADGVNIELESKKISTITAPATEYILDNSMSPGSSTVLRKGRKGSKYETYKNYYKDGELIETVLAYTSTYRAIAEQVAVGPEAHSTSGSADDYDVPDDDSFIPDEEILEG